MYKNSLGTYGGFAEAVEQNRHTGESTIVAPYFGVIIMGKHDLSGPSATVL